MSKSLSDEEFCSLMDLMMCSDPYPVDSGETVLRQLLNGEAGARGYGSWTEAYHGFETEGPADGAAGRDPEFVRDEPCDWHVSGDEPCGEMPTAFVGDIYYACEDHFDDYRRFLGGDDG